MAEWGSLRWYWTRVKNISGVGSGTRRNGDYFLRKDRADPADDTVFEDDAVDVLWGNGGLDWFFANDDDRLKDRRRWEAEANLDSWW